MPSDAVNDNVGFASGTEILIAAGTAIYDALAAKVARIAVPPTDRSNVRPTKIPTIEKTKGAAMPKPIKNTPYLFKLPRCVDVIKPISNKNSASTPLNKSTNNGAIDSTPSGPEIQPINKPPTNKITPLPRKTSFAILPH